MTTKDFEYFENRRVMINENMDELWGRILAALQGDRWRQMRSSLSPSFTGSKLRKMFDHVSDYGNGIVRHFMDKVENGEKINVEMKDFFWRYANDSTASCFFGIETNSFADPQNAFLMTGLGMVNLSGFYKTLKFLLTAFFPKFVRFINLKLMNQEESKAFKHIVLDTMTLRRENGISRPDMMNVLIQKLNDTLQIGEEETAHRKWSDNELAGQCLAFFFAGTEAISTTLTYIAYELVANPDIQQKLYGEIAETHQQLNGKPISYDDTQKMKYLDQVTSETLRKWPAAINGDRICGKDYVYDDGNLKFKIEKGTGVIYSIVGIHHDPKYFPNPEKFDPDRFSDENKHNIVPGSYIPFGIGPRTCIGRLVHTEN